MVQSQIVEGIVGRPWALTAKTRPHLMLFFDRSKPPIKAGDLMCGSDKLVSDCYFESELDSAATVIPKHRKISRFIANHPQLSLKKKGVVCYSFLTTTGILLIS
jgi:hypothetical protein